MSAPERLDDLYTEELKALWSANDQMLRTLKKIVPKATDQKLKDMLPSRRTASGSTPISSRKLIADAGKGVEGALQGHGRPRHRSDQACD